MIPTVALKEIAPARPITLRKASNDLVLQVTLDQIESNTGALLKAELKPFAQAGVSTHAFDARHVLYSKLRPYLNKVLLPETEGIGTTELVPMEPDTARLDRRYLAYYLKSPRFVSWATEHSSGAKMPRVNMSDFWAHEIPLPELSDQIRIVTILDKADSIRRSRQKNIGLADNFLRSVFLNLFGDPVVNPRGFPLGAIRDLVESAHYGTSAKADSESGEYPILRMGNITYAGHMDYTDLKYIDLVEKDKAKYLVRKGDLLFNRTNSKELVGKTAVYDRDDPMAIAGYLIRVRANSKGNPYYLSGYLNSGHGKQTLQNMCKSIVGMANINAQELQDMRILMPPTSLQERFESIVMAVKAKTRLMIEAEKQANDLFNALSQKAFNGEL